MKQNYVQPTLEILLLSKQDILTASNSDPFDGMDNIL